ncbi:NUDIX hydrolase [Nocardia cyriacigeorgica]|uniref:NUDIX hydrolase n=1 Tax=Nocardia cyriacigeorgica TaxID=135487 RepID=UPI003EDFA8CB
MPQGNRRDGPDATGNTRPRRAAAPHRGAPRWDQRLRGRCRGIPGPETAGRATGTGRLSRRHVRTARRRCRNGESFAESVARELHEETGLRLRAITDFLGSFDYATRTKARVRKFAFVVEAEPGEVELAPGEHDAYAWIDAEALAELPMAPDMRQTVIALVSTGIR